MTPLDIRGVCPHDCPDTCGIVTTVEAGRATAVRGDSDHPITRGWLCAKVRPYLDHVYHPDRLTHPLRRLGSKTDSAPRWARIGWDEALATIAERWQAIIAESGAAAILPFSYSGTLGMVQMAAANGRFWNRMGASRLQRSICGAAAEAAVEMTLGARMSPPYAALRQSRLILLWGHNPVSTAPHLMPHLEAARRAGARLVVIDPRRTATARRADLHLAPLPATDGALALGIGNIIVRDGLQDAAWLRAHASGWPDLRERLKDYPPERVAAITGIPAQAIEDLARDYASTQPALIRIADGLQRHPNGGQTVRAICCLPALTGQYGIPGGGLAYSASGSVRWSEDALNRWSGSPPPARRVNMNRLGAALLGEVDDPPIRSLFVYGANPACSNPNTGSVIRGLQREDLFTVVHELFMTDTAMLADLVLPATSQLEQADLHTAYGHHRLAYNAPAIPPLGEARSNWDLMRALAEAMGFDEPWLRADADAVIEDILRETAAEDPRFGAAGITLDRLKREGDIALPVDAVPFEGGRFPTADGRIALRCELMRSQGLDPLPEYREPRDDSATPAPPDSLKGRQVATRRGGATNAPRAQDLIFDPSMALNLISPAAHHFVSSSLAGQAGLRRLEGEPRLEIHPDDAAARGIGEGDPLHVANARGWCRLRAHVTEAVRPGVVASPKGHWPQHHGGRNLNRTTSDALGDLAGQSTFHTNRVWVRVSRAHGPDEGSGA